MRIVVAYKWTSDPQEATVRADGSPRISGIECEFADGELRFGSMPGARKGADLTRDPRFALHGPTFHPHEGKEAEWPGEAKIAGRAVPARVRAACSRGGRHDARRGSGPPGRQVRDGSPIRRELAKRPSHTERNAALVQLRFE